DTNTWNNWYPDGSCILEIEVWKEFTRKLGVCGCDVRRCIWEVVGVGKGRSSGMQFKGAFEIQLDVHRQLHEQVDVYFSWF
nr:hypothetical protein [Tanacetum cinerariifolium]